jgi:putative ABC transport system permease protein
MVEARGYFADPSFFEVFSFGLEGGNLQTALMAPNSMIITQELAFRLFDEEDPLGKTIDLSDRQLAFPVVHDGVGASASSWGSFTITGIIDAERYKSHLKFDVLVSSSSMPALYTQKKLEDFSANWEWYFRTYTYALLYPDKNEADLNNALSDLVAHKYANLTADHVKGFRLSAQPLGDVQLGLMGNDTNNRLPRIGYYFLGILALVIMVSACLNYTNLSVARALTRAKEIGVRKVTGANRGALVFQFLSEAVITSLLALGMAVVLLLFIKPAFRNLWVNKHLNFELPEDPSVYLVFTGFALLIGLIAGAYPALHLSTYQPVKVLKQLGGIRPGKLGMRKVLSVSQFVISLFFITTSILIFDQFKYYRDFDYGFNAQDIVNVELQGIDYQKLSQEFSSVPGVSTISASDIVPATGQNNGMELKKPGEEGEYTMAGILLTDENFISNLRLRLIAGENLPATDSLSRYIVVNEEMVKKLGYQRPSEIIGQVLESRWGKESLVVIGVVEDFRYKLLINAHEIGPLVLRNQPNFQYLNVKIASPDVMGTVAQMEEKWKRIDPAHPFKYEFFDEQLASSHQALFDIVTILGFITFLAVIIACLGMLGMATYTAERKKKEVGIRKVLGAEDLRIAFLLSKEFLKVLVIAVCIGAPFSYLVNSLWLQQLPNRVEFGFATVFLATVTLLVLGLITVASQTIKASRTNPVESLKTE